MTYQIEDTKIYELLAHNLSRFGFPMVHDGMDTTDLSMEELIVTIMKDMPNPRFILGASIILYKNEINSNRLYNLAIEQDVVNPVGWILEESYNALTRVSVDETDIKELIRPDIKELIQQLEPLKKDEETLIGLEKTDWHISYAKERQTPISKKWSVLNGFREKSFDEELEKRCTYAKKT